MKSNFIKFIGTSMGAATLAAGLTVLPLTIPARAQTGTDRTTTTTPNTEIYNDTTPDRGMDWGWLGLLGLIGLAGLAGRNKHNDEPTRYRDPNAVGTGTYRE